MLADLLYRMRAIFHPKTLERELDEELKLHLEYETAKLMEPALAATTPLVRHRSPSAVRNRFANNVATHAASLFGKLYGKTSATAGGNSAGTHCSP